MILTIGNFLNGAQVIIELQNWAKVTVIYIYLLYISCILTFLEKCANMKVLFLVLIFHKIIEKYIYFMNFHIYTELNATTTNAV